MEAATFFSLGSVFEAWRPETFEVWLTTGFFYVSVPRQPAIQPAIQPPEDGAEVLPEELWPDTDDGF